MPRRYPIFSLQVGCCTNLEAGSEYAVDLEYKTNAVNYIILHKQGAYYDSEDGWGLGAFYPGIEWAVDMEVR